MEIMMPVSNLNKLQQKIPGINWIIKTCAYSSQYLNTSGYIIEICLYRHLLVKSLLMEIAEVCSK